MDGVVTTAIKELLEEAIGPEYIVLLEERFRLAETVAQPDLAVVARDAYEREVLFRPAHAAGLNIVPMVAIILDFQGLSYEEGRDLASPYFARGTSAVCFAEPDRDFLSCYCSDGSYLDGGLSSAETMFRRALLRSAAGA